MLGLLWLLWQSYGRGRGGSLTSGTGNLQRRAAYQSPIAGIERGRVVSERNYNQLADEMWERALDATDPLDVDAFTRLALAYSQMARMGAELAVSGWPPPGLVPSQLPKPR